MEPDEYARRASAIWSSSVSRGTRGNSFVPAAAGLAAGLFVAGTRAGEVLVPFVALVAFQTGAELTPGAGAAALMAAGRAIAVRTGWEWASDFHHTTPTMPATNTKNTHRKNPPAPPSEAGRRYERRGGTRRLTQMRHHFSSAQKQPRKIPARFRPPGPPRDYGQVSAGIERMTSWVSLSSRLVTVQLIFGA